MRVLVLVCTCSVVPRCFASLDDTARRACCNCNARQRKACLGS